MIKKRLYILILCLLSSILFVSCKKYTCECTLISPYGEKGGTGSRIVKGTKSNAKADCESYSSEPDATGYSYDCDIKL